MLLPLLAAPLALAQPAPQPAPHAEPAKDAVPIAELRSVAESSDYKATALHAQVVSFLDAMAQDHRVTRLTLGTSTQGREIPLVILADPPIRSAEEARTAREMDGKVVVFIIGNIHAGEVCGKEALPMLARDLLVRNDPLLSRLIIAIAPIYNCDGNEQVDVNNRPGQNGPELGMGKRENGQGLDLNRDFIKLEAPETRALVGFLNAWDPLLFIDTHTTNGSHHRFTITYGGPKALAGDEAVRLFFRDRFMPQVADRYSASCGEPTFYYGSFGDGVFGDPAHDKATWGTYPAEARFGTNYVGLRGRMSLLSEAYSYAPYKDRVLRTYDFVHAALAWCDQNHDELSRLCDGADARAKASPRDMVAIRTRTVACPGKVTVLGFEEEIKNGRSVSTGIPRDYSVDLLDCYEPELSVARPRAYRIERDVRLEPVIDNLRMHGVMVSEVRRATTIPGERLTITKATAASRPFQGHVLVKAEVEAAAADVPLNAGDWYISTAQPLGNLIVYALEPQSEDGLATWNFFDPWLTPGATFPVWRITAPSIDGVE